MPAQHLLTAVKLGRYELPNRVVMAPMTRSRAYNRDQAPTELHAEYYAQRATAELLITEGSQISPQGAGYLHTPGIHSEAQIRGWKKVSDAVHASDGHIFIQLWHMGRVSLPDFHNGALPVAASAVNPHTQSLTPLGLKGTVTSRAPGIDEVRQVVRDYVQAAQNGMQAGFDGVKIHGANGYLIEQFLRDASNTRNDEYGGSVPNRARFLFEIVDSIGADRVGVRLSPANTWNVPADSDSCALYDFIMGALSGYKLAYLHLREGQGDLSGISNMVTRVTERYRTIYQGTLITNTDYDRDKGNAVIANGYADLVAYGTPFISNPDLVERFRVSAPLAQANQSTFYQDGAQGYVDYPKV